MVVVLETVVGGNRNIWNFERVDESGRRLPTVFSDNIENDATMNYIVRGLIHKENLQQFLS